MDQKLYEIHDMVLNFFEGDEELAQLWFDTPNPLLDSMSPTELIELGKVDRLHLFVVEQIEGNIR